MPNRLQRVERRCLAPPCGQDRGTGPPSDDDTPSLGDEDRSSAGTATRCPRGASFRLRQERQLRVTLRRVPRRAVPTAMDPAWLLPNTMARTTGRLTNGLQFYPK
jgi:hypothetical protein